MGLAYDTDRLFCESGNVCYQNMVTDALALLADGDAITVDLDGNPTTANPYDGYLKSLGSPHSRRIWRWPPAAALRV